MTKFGNREEHIVTNPETGGAKASKAARFDLIPPAVLWALAEHYGAGADKYGDRNYEKGYDWSLSYAALMRHLMAWWGGENVDDETGSHHLQAVVWHAVALLQFAQDEEQYGRFDDRVRSPFGLSDRPVGTLSKNESNG